MAALQRIEISGHRLVVLEEAEYERLCREAGREATEDSALPAFPESDTSGRFPALEYTRVQFARNLIGQRKALGLSQQQLADLAGVRPETCRDWKAAGIPFPARPRRSWNMRWPPSKNDGPAAIERFHAHHAR
jgi:hypothetical protein